MIQVCFHWGAGRYGQKKKEFDDKDHADRYIAFMERKYPSFVLDDVFTIKPKPPKPVEPPKKVPTERERLEEKLNKGEISREDLTFGHKMLFGKYRGEYVYFLLVKRRQYIEWALQNTNFSLNETETWWKETIDALAEKHKEELRYKDLAECVKDGDVSSGDDAEAEKEEKVTDCPPPESPEFL